MKKGLLTLSCLLFTIPTATYATNCDTIIQQITKKINANGVTDFTLEAIEKGTVTNKKIVGVCGGGTKDIIYQRNISSERPTTQQQKPTTTESNIEQTN